MTIVDEVLAAACLWCGCTLKEVLPSGDERRQAQKCIKCGTTFVVWHWGEDEDEQQPRET